MVNVRALIGTNAFRLLPSADGLTFARWNSISRNLKISSMLIFARGMRIVHAMAIPNTLWPTPKGVR